MMYKEIKGDLIELALQGKFAVIVHGCNCFCQMGAGIAVAMKKTFNCDDYDLEHYSYKGDINKLGNIEYQIKEVYFPDNSYTIIDVVNAYTQYHYRKNYEDGKTNPIDYEALTLCMRKINHAFIGKHVGLPQIGAGLAGGDWNKIKSIIQKELVDCDVTVVIYNK